jgi:hypothetical protein
MFISPYSHTGEKIIPNADVRRKEKSLKYSGA